MAQPTQTTARITVAMERIKYAGGYVPASVHFSQRKYDKKFEVVAQMTYEALDALELSIGGEVVLDIQDNRQDALSSVRFFRGHA